MSSTAQTKTPSGRNRRTLAVAGTDIDPEVVRLAASFYEENKKANVATGIAKKARAELFALLTKKGVRKDTVEAVIDNRPITLDITVGAKPMQYIDVEELSKAVPLETLLKIVSASAKAVEDEAGTGVKVRCLKSGFYAENVDVTVHNVA